tara:strand:+ start:288 stop:788 length:501 start_codon:yes stop_codon:yes gene_type:complete
MSRKHTFSMGAGWGIDVQDEFAPMVEDMLSQLAPEVSKVLLDDLLQPVFDRAKKSWPVGDYSKSTGKNKDRVGGRSRDALQMGDGRNKILFDGKSVYAMISNNAREPHKNRLYAYLIFFKGAKAAAGRVYSKRNVWQVLVRRPFLKRVKKIEGKLIEAINAAGGLD